MPEDQVRRKDQIVAIPDQEYGAVPLDHGALLKVVQQAAGDRLRTQQLRLLLRGEEGLENRINKIQFDKTRTRAVMLETAIKYGMALKEPTVDHPEDPQNAAWQVVGKEGQKAHDEPAAASTNSESGNCGEPL